ncbi:glycosyltransferase family 4 protein [Homoserinibacter sp. GY 40078]|uniref:glycosyltransferase family 4 protein n=1 Tax=Homoserinibacter sp. GY 40078 TaxID=2603275 RepID=UPI0011C9F351|nr:glycosyltransferase family 4 protein [Homoserinibacter sp. GY 40078]TXK19499.1 glycosyltransferase family 4 protein [Homoserinibacter sp. GY 40078]
MTVRLVVVVRRLSFADGIGGLERAAGEHARSLAERGVPVTIVTDRRSMRGDPPAGIDVLDVPWPRFDRYKALSTFGLAYQLWVTRVAKALATSGNGRGVLHLHGASAGVLRHRAIQDAFPTTIVNPHGMEEFGRFSLLRVPNRLFTRHLARGSAHARWVIATDAGLQDAVTRNLRVPPERVALIPNAVDVDALRALDAGGTRPAEFTIVSVGRLVHNKGFDLLADALARPDVREALPEGYRWRHYGSGPDAERIVAKAHAARVPLEIASGRSDAEVQTAVAGASLFVQPSRYEGSSLTTLEAMAHGRLIVGTPVGGIPDKIEDGVTGILAEAATADAIGDALQRAMGSDPETLGTNARALVDGRFSLAAAADAYLALYEQDGAVG